MHMYVPRNLSANIIFEFQVCYVRIQLFYYLLWKVVLCMCLYTDLWPRLSYNSETTNKVSISCVCFCVPFYYIPDNALPNLFL